MIKYFIGPVTKNVVDSVIEFCSYYNESAAFIPSRRQVDVDGGYVNSWDTESFCSYVKKRNSSILIERDHGGPGQGYYDDDGLRSLKEDCKRLDIIHIDPWKKYSDYLEGIYYTVFLINYCYSLNNNIQFEIGTEQSIRNFEVDELEKFILDLKNKYLNSKVFDRIKYLVIQSGTSLKGVNQTGKYNRFRLADMVSLSKMYGFFSKEHNGDYISSNLIKEKFKSGLDCINIAPEFGLIETNVYLEHINNDNKLLEDFWMLCYNSRRWVKWVDKNFNPYENKLDLIKICGHYVISLPKFKNIKDKLSVNIDSFVKESLTIKLEELYDGV